MRDDQTQEASTPRPSPAPSTSYGTPSGGNMLSPTSGIQIGLMVTLLGVFGSGIWGASRINTKLDNLTAMVSKAVSTTETTERRLSDHSADDQKRWTELESRIGVLERSGSIKAQELERDINLLRRDFEVHKAVAPVFGK